MLRGEDQRMIANKVVVVFHQSEIASVLFDKIVKKLINSICNVRINLICLCEKSYDLYSEASNLESFNDILLLRINNSFSYPSLIADYIINSFQDNKPDAILVGNHIVSKACGACLAQKLRTGLAADCSDFEYDNGLFYFKRIVGEWPPSIATIVIRKTKPQMASFVNINWIESAPPFTKQDSRKAILSEIFISDCNVPILCNNIVTKKNNTDSYNTYFIAGAGICDIKRIKCLEAIANHFDIGFGVTRQIINRGWYNEPFLIGLSGKQISPNLCVTFGVSGAIQHLEAIKDSKHIYAVNNSIDAPIFSIAEIKILTDVNQLIDSMKLFLI